MLLFEQYLEDIQLVFSKETQEYKLLQETYNLLSKGIPTTGAEAINRLKALESLRPQLSFLVYGLNEKTGLVSSKYYEVYSPRYSRYAKQALLNSTHAIDMRLYSEVPEILVLQRTKESHENLILFIKQLVRCLDSNKSSVELALKDSFRLD